MDGRIDGRHTTEPITIYLILFSKREYNNMDIKYEIRDVYS